MLLFLRLLLSLLLEATLLIFLKMASFLMFRFPQSQPLKSSSDDTNQPPYSTSDSWSSFELWARSHCIRDKLLTLWDSRNTLTLLSNMARSQPSRLSLYTANTPTMVGIHLGKAEHHQLSHTAHSASVKIWKLLTSFVRKVRNLFRNSWIVELLGYLLLDGDWKWDFHSRDSSWCDVLERDTYYRCSPQVACLDSYQCGLLTWARVGVSSTCRLVVAHPY